MYQTQIIDTIYTGEEYEHYGTKSILKPNSDLGYCIRTGNRIPFDPSRPFSYEAYQSWVIFENWDYPEKYCHKTGKFSNGKTSMANPIL